MLACSGLKKIERKILKREKSASAVKIYQALSFDVRNHRFCRDLNPRPMDPISV
jgi:gluconate kinase